MLTQVTKSVKKFVDDLTGNKPTRRKSRKPRKITKAQWKQQVQPVIRKAKKSSYNAGKRAKKR